MVRPAVESIWDTRVELADTTWVGNDSQVGHLYRKEVERFDLLGSRG
jgi:hypothetical protein